MVRQSYPAHKKFHHAQPIIYGSVELGLPRDLVYFDLFNEDNPGYKQLLAWNLVPCYQKSSLRAKSSKYESSSEEVGF